MSCKWHRTLYNCRASVYGLENGFSWKRNHNSFTNCDFQNNIHIGLKNYSLLSESGNGFFCQSWMNLHGQCRIQNCNNLLLLSNANHTQNLWPASIIKYLSDNNFRKATIFFCPKGIFCSKPIHPKLKIKKVHNFLKRPQIIEIE